MEAEGFDRQPCGGTHPRTTAEVGVVVITALERYKGGTRVPFVCGHRALAAIARRQARPRPAGRDAVGSARRARGLGAEGEGRPRRAAERRAKALLERALEGDARRLLAEARGEGPAAHARHPPPSSSTAFDGWPPSDLRVLATHLVALAPCVALLGSRADKAHLVFAQSEGLPHDIPALLKAAVEHLGGRGGGRGNLAQGGGERLDLLDEALQRARDAVQARS